jgi:hypothetical protein
MESTENSTMKRPPLLGRGVLLLFLLLAVLGCDPPPPGRTRPYGCDIFVRGTFFDPDAAASRALCDDRNRMTFVGKQTYVCTLLLEPGTYFFKIGDVTWRAVEIGAREYQTVIEPQQDPPWQDTISGKNAREFSVTIPTAGQYVCEIRALARTQAQVRIRKQPQR